MLPFDAEWPDTSQRSGHPGCNGDETKEWLHIPSVKDGSITIVPEEIQCLLQSQGRLPEAGGGLLEVGEGVRAGAVITSRDSHHAADSLGI